MEYSNSFYLFFYLDLLSLKTRRLSLRIQIHEKYSIS